ncbi:MAG: HAMP domain-containing histidine kinase [Clostridiales bacterium]|nr:HAMP domain-containing histidine kinase [Clostridiales bacterium]
MKLFWKILLSTLIIMMLTFSLGGYLLISSMFRTSLEREIQSAKADNQLLYQFAAAELADLSYQEPQRVLAVLDDVIERMENSQMVVRLIHNSETVHESEGLADTQPLQLPARNERLTQLLEQNGRYQVRSASALGDGDETFCLVTYRDVTDVFTERRAQMSLYRSLLFVLLVLNSVAIALLAFWITRPVAQLSGTVRRFSRGRFDKRARVRTDDEIGQLAEDFNSMADSLEARMEDLKEAARRQEAFTGSFAHEVKTPLTSIIGYADMLRSQQMDEESRIMAADRVFREGKRLEALSHKLLELIVLEKQDFMMRRINPAYLLGETVKLLEGQTAGTGIQIFLDAQDAYLFAEPDLLTTLLVNLMDNARKALDGQGEIHVTGRLEAGEYHTQIRDTGKGIAPEDLDKITDAFYMADKARTRAAGGAGLGLAISQRIVELHEGRLEFESELGQGTTVHLYLKGGGQDAQPDSEV